ncbi:MAG: DUF2938 family protein [Gammaproteobacteria bacterium]|nr:DUF2938 family protein [Gammaproteobacteria bacterium]
MHTLTFSELIKIFIRGIIIGFFATMFMDLWTLFLFFITGHPIDWGIIGKVVGYLFQGDLILPDMSQYHALEYQNAIGWMTHYTVGFIYAIAFELIVLHGLRYKVSLLKTLLFAWILMFFPFCVLSPLFSHGFFFMDSVSPLHNILYTISCHTMFGIGLWLGTLLSKAIVKSKLMARWVITAGLLMLLAVVISCLITWIV